MGIEVDASGPEAACHLDYKHCLRDLIYVCRELIGVPSVLVVTPVRINASQHPGIGSCLKVMLEGVAGKGGMVDLHVEREVLVKAVVPEKTYHSCGIVVILVLGGLHGLGLNVKLALESLLTCIITSKGEHHCQVLKLTLHVSVMKCEVALTSAPEYVPLTAKSNCCVYCILQLHTHIRKHVEIRIGGGSVHVTGVAENICRTPQKLHPRLFLPCLDHRHPLLEALLDLKY